MKEGGSKVQQQRQQKTKECSLYGFLIQVKESKLSQQQPILGGPSSRPHAKLLQFCQFLANNNHRKSHQVKFRETITMFQPKLRDNYWKVAQLVTHQKVALPVDESGATNLDCQGGGDRFSDVALTADQTDFERASSDLTGSSGVFSQSQKLKLFSDQLTKYSNVTIKKCHVVRAAKASSRGERLTNLTARESIDQSVPPTDPGLRCFLEGSGFESRSVKQLVGDEFKFVLNDYPDVSKFDVGSSEFGTVKLRIYKVFTQQRDDQEQHVAAFYQQAYNQAMHLGLPARFYWKEVNVLTELFEEEQNNDNNEALAVKSQTSQDEMAAAAQRMLQEQQQYQDQPPNFDSGNNNVMIQDENKNQGVPGQLQPQRDDPMAAFDQGQVHGAGMGGYQHAPYERRDFSHYPSEPSIFEQERSMARMQPSPMMQPQAVHEEYKQGGLHKQESQLSHFELYHVELTGMCADRDLNLYTEMLASFAQKFSSFVELAPVTLNSLSELDQQ